MAYFTEPMSDEFRKAIEEAMRELENEEARKESKAKSRSMKHLMHKTKRELK